MTVIKELRNQLNWTQSKLSTELEIPLPTLKKWEIGDRKPAPWAEKLIIEKLENILEGAKMKDEKLLKELLDTNLAMKESVESRTHAENVPDKYDYLPYWWAIWAYDFELECGDEPEASDFKEALADIA